VTRRHAGAAVGLLVGALAVWAGWVEPRRLKVREVALPLPRWPTRLDGLRVALVADLHAGGPHVRESDLERVVARVNAAAPDLVALLGDYVDPSVALARRIPPERVAERLAGLRAPLGAVAVLGNHDWAHEGARVPRALRAAGIVVLEDDAVPAGDPARGLWLAGLADARHRSPDVREALAGVPEHAAIVLLTHDPDVFPLVPERVALTVAGHTHGGQLDVPVLRRLAIPSRYGLRYAGGHVEEGGRHLFVSRGIGEAGVPARFRAPPEVVILRLEARGGP
jgi:predicted MPP superfamily phosphohydrolase